MEDKKNTNISAEKTTKKLTLLSEEDILAPIQKEECEEGDENCGNHHPTLEQKTENKIIIFRRILHICGAFAMAVFLLVITIVLDVKSQEMTRSNLFRINGNGESRFSLYGEDFFPVEKTKVLFGGETIDVESGSAQMEFSDGTRVKAETGSQFFLLQLEPYPIFILEKGEIWFFGLGESQFLAGGVRLFPRGASGILRLENGKLFAAAYRQPITMEIPTQEKNVSVIIPNQKRVSFVPKNIPDTLGDIRFSKIKKEILFSNQTISEQVKSNISSDERWMDKNYSALVFQNTKETKNNFSGLLTLFSLYPEKQLDNEVTLEEKTKREVFRAFILGKKENALNTHDLSDENITFLLLTFPQVPAKKISIPEFKKILEEAEKRATIDPYLIAQSLFSVFKNVLSSQDIPSSEQILSKVSLLWNDKKNTPENERLLDMYRENITSSIEQNISQITGKIFSQIANLDDLALAWENGEKDVITLEVVERNIETINAFLYKEEFDNAEMVLKKNDELLKTKPSTYLLGKFRDTKERNTMMWQKYSIFAEKGVLSDKKLKLAIKKQAEQKQTVEKIYNAQEFFLHSADTQDVSSAGEMQINTSSKGREEKTKADFAEIGITVLSMNTKEKNGKPFVEISRAITSSGLILRAEYFPESQVVQKVETSKKGVEIQGEINLRYLSAALTSLQKNHGDDLASLKKNAAKTWAINEDDSLKDIPPQVIDITKRLALAELEKREWNATLRDITMIAENTVRITEIIIPELKGQKLSFTLSVDTKAVRDAELLPAKKKVNATNIDELLKKALVVYTTYNKDKHDKQETKAMLERVRIDTETQGVIKKNSSGVNFQGMKYEGMNISGVADVDTKQFLVFLIDGKSLGKNIPFSEFQEKFNTYVGKE